MGLAMGLAALLVAGSVGKKQASVITKLLSLAKLITKSHAIGSKSRISRLTTTHLISPRLVGMHQGE